MGVNGPEEKRINFAGVNFNANEVSSYGKSEGLYYIDFKDGTKVQFVQQNRGASIYSDSFSTFNRHNFNNFDNIFVKGSEEEDYYQFNSCNGGSISTYKDDKQDVIDINHGCNDIRVAKSSNDILYNDGHGTFVND